MRSYSVILLAATLLMGGCAHQSKVAASKRTSHASVAANNVDSRAMEYVLRAATAEASGDLWQAVTLYRLATDADPHSASIHATLAEMYNRIGEHSAARKEIQLAYSLAPNDEAIIERYLQTAVVARDVRKIEQLLQHWQTLPDSEGKSTSKIAEYFLMVGNKIAAREVLVQSIQKFGERAAWLERLAALDVIEQDWKTGADRLKRLAVIEPDRVERWIEAGQISLAAGDTSAADSLFHVAIRTAPAEPEGWRMAILSATSRGLFKRSDSLLAAALQAAPESPELWTLEARRFQRSKDFSGALRASKHANSLDSTQLSHYIDIGFFAHELKEYNEAESAYKRALVLDSSSALVLNNYAYLLSTQGIKLDTALLMVNRAIEKDSDNPSYLDTRGWVYYQMKQYDLALLDLFKALKSDDINAEIHDHIGDVLLAMNRIKEAREHWERALQLNPEFSEVRRKLERHPL